LSALGGVSMIWLDAPDVRSRVARMARLAESERFRSRPLHAELFSSLRFDVGYRETCEEGIPIGAAEIELPARPFFRLMKSWAVMRLLNLFRTYWLVGWRAAYFPVRLSPNVGLIVGHGEIRTAAASAGRGLERIWLRASNMGLAMQPMAAGPLYALPQFGGVAEDVREDLRSAWGQLVANGTPLMLFRLGHAAAPSARTGRPPLSHFLTPSGTTLSGVR
jgi:hypothetical protein